MARTGDTSLASAEFREAVDKRTTHTRDIGYQVSYINTSLSCIDPI
jgi:hypothetical protein